MRALPAFAVLALFIVLLAPSRPPIAQTNLITNGTFDTDTTGWSNSTSGTIAWVGTEGHTAVGAAQATNLRASTSAYSAGGVQCVSLPAPQADYYTIKGWVKVPTQANTTAQGYVRLQFYTNTDCTNATGDTRDSSLVPAGSDWTFVSKTTSRPAGALSVQARIYVRKSGTESAYAYFDDIVLYASSATPVTTLHITALATQGLFPWPLLSVLISVLLLGGTVRFRHTLARFPPLVPRLALLLVGVLTGLTGCARNKVTVRWRTETELDLAGFLVYRSSSPEGPWEQVSSVIPAQGDSLRGTEYLYVDPHPGNARYYLIEEIRIDGTRQRYKPIPIATSSFPILGFILVPAIFIVVLVLVSMVRK